MKIILRRKGGPGSGNFNHKGRPGLQGGSAPKSSSYTYARNSAEWREKAATNAPAPSTLYRWANLLEIHDAARGDRNRSLDVSEDPDFYFAPPKSLTSDSFVQRTYGRFILDGNVLQAAGYRRDAGLFGEMAWRHMSKYSTETEQQLLKTYLSAIKGFEVLLNPAQLSIEELHDWMRYRLGRDIQITKSAHYTEERTY